MKKSGMHPFVKWAGGKKQLLGKLDNRIPENFNTYFEPFVGGGALFFHLHPERAVINDSNLQLINAFRWLRADADAVISKINLYDKGGSTKEQYLMMRDRYNAKITAGELDAECAALMIWINKHCFNGLYRVNSKGLFNVPFNNRTTGPSINSENLLNISRYLNENRIEIRLEDFESACADARPGDFIYFDSPYIPASRTARFTDYTKDGFTPADHRRLAALYRTLDRRGVQLMLSNNNVPLVRELYAGFKIEEISARRSINSDATKRVGSEVIITNY